MEKQTEFDLMIVDADTALFRAAKFIQEDYIVVTHKSSGRTLEFANKTLFWGHWKKKAGGELSKINEKRGEKDLPPFLPEEFEIEELARLSPEIKDHLEEAEKSFDYFIGHIKKIANCKDYHLYIGGDYNFRYDIAHILKYKGERKEKPILFEEVRDLILKKYKNKITICEGVEADDQLSVLGAENYKHFRKTGEWKYLLCYIDKDIKMVISPHINPDKEEGIIFNTPLEAARCYCSQLISGDLGTDNILGLPNLSEEVQEKYSLRKSKGVGVATALKLLEGAESIKELFERVVEAYRGYYGADITVFTSHRGEEIGYSWLDFLQENAMLLYMHHSDHTKYQISDTLDKLGVDYE